MADWCSAATSGAKLCHACVLGLQVTVLTPFQSQHNTSIHPYNYTSIHSYILQIFVVASVRNARVFMHLCVGPDGTVSVQVAAVVVLHSAALSTVIICGNNIVFISIIRATCSKHQPESSPTRSSFDGSHRSLRAINSDISSHIIAAPSCGTSSSSSSSPVTQLRVPYGRRT